MAKKQRETILIIEDDAATADLISEALADGNYQIVRATEGGEALRLIDQLRPCAITLDLALPGLDGRSFLLGLRSNEATKRTPVIVVSANSESLNLFERRAVTRVLPKPFDVEELRQAIQGVAHA